MQRHSLPFTGGQEERIIGPLSIRQFMWLGGGAFLIYQMLINGIMLPVPAPLNLITFLPIAIVAVGGAYAKFKSVYITEYVVMWWDCKKRNRKLVNIPRKDDM